VFKLTAVAAVTLLACTAVSASMFYRNEPATSLETSAGFNAGETDYFLVKLRIYNPAKGVAAFPDGGSPKDAFESIYLFRLDKRGPRKAAELGIVRGASDVYFKSSSLRAGKGGVLIRVPWYDKKVLVKRIEYFVYDRASGKTAITGDPGGVWPKATLSLGETGKLFRDFSDFDAAGLPNPLDYMPGAGKPEGLAGIISKGLGERRLRLAAARRLISTGNEGLLRSAIADLDKIAASRKIYFWGEEKALLEEISAMPGEKKGE